MLSRLVVREADRLSRLLGEFNDFARVGVAERKQIDLRKVIGDAIAMVQQQPESTDRATFEVDIEPPLDDLWGDPDLVHQTLTNLILNAVQVSDPEEPVTVRVIADSLKPELVPAEVVGGMPVRIRVVDDGPGIAPDDIGRIFDPFYTRRQGGSGMGLAIAHRAVQAHGGALLVSSSPGNGATFVIILPRRDWQEREELERKGWSELVAEIESPDGPGTAGRAGRTTSRSDEVTDRLG
jgi:signal transduction histidine kinase